MKRGKLCLVGLNIDQCAIEMTMSLWFFKKDFTEEHEICSPPRFDDYIEDNLSSTIGTEIHKRKLTFLHSLTTCSNKKTKEIINRQIAVNYDNNKSFFYQTALLLSKYNLPDILGKNIAIPSKLSWKKLAKTEISTFWTLKLKDEAHQISSLKFLNLNFGIAETTHPVLDSVGQNLIEIRKATTKVRMLNGT
ncbi:unnamed protein product [Mytilus coruscus]|uniref:Uncharacterized protein n=1 Tax=Mytilus coruscus TaxID=42192 RepID=A0A6J8CXZ1_MYTCO|nr:unnamed protein product [Mytilus coruscus]